MEITKRTLVAGATALGMSKALSGAAMAQPAAPITIDSPDGRLSLTLSDSGGALRYWVALDGRQVLAPSQVVIQSDGKPFGKEGVLGEPRLGRVNETYRFFGAKSIAVNRARVATIPVTSGDETYALDVHVADDGVGVRLRLPAKADRRIEADLSSWTLPGDPTLWATSYEPGYERMYRTTTLSGLGAEGYGLPVTARIGSAYVTLSEACLIDYGELAVKRRDDGALEGYLPTDWKGWRTDSEVVQPWRVAIVARTLTELINTTLVQNLNPPPEPSLADADWILPGRCAWQWMAIGAPEFEDQRQWVDWTRDLGFEYYLVDEGWSEWPDAWASLKSVCDYAKTKGVKIWLWAHAREVADAEVRDAYFRRSAEIGIVGVKVDFPEPANHWWSTWYRDATRDAAAYRLLINFHGAAKPTGIERTWPNELTREAIRGHEYHITRYRRVLEPQQDTILPFTRYVIGPADYTPTVFEPRELQGNTWAHELAQAIVFSSPFLCMGGHPRDYVANPARDVISALPAVWDESIALPGSEPGTIAALARRAGDQWFIGVLNGADVRALEVNLTFLGRGSWTATCLGDVPGRPDAWDRRDERVTARSSLRASLPARGGFVVWIRK